jgi:glutaconate CoA-transferase, subunit B
VTGSAAALFGTAIPVAAMELPRRTHAPGLTILLAGWSRNPDLGQLDEIPDSEFDAALCDLLARPSRWTTLDNIRSSAAT